VDSYALLTDGDVTRVDIAPPIRGARNHTYPVFIGEDPTEHFIRHIGELPDLSTIVIIADENTAEVIGPALEISLITAGYRVIPLTIPAGEEHKTWAVAGEIAEAIAQERITSSDLIVGLGGGVVCDLAGFVAATYHRGVRLALIPTSLVAMVDASIGGKSGVNLRAGKNLAGARLDPSAVLIDFDLLATLPDAEYRAGLAEIAKMSLLGGEESLSWLEAHAPDLVLRDPAALLEATVMCIKLQAEIDHAQDDEAWNFALTFGHTLAYSLERLMGYGNVSHGDAVAEGLRFATLASTHLVDADVSLFGRCTVLLERLGLGRVEHELTTISIAQTMDFDKKNVGGVVRLLLMPEPGKLELVTVTENVLFEQVRNWAGREAYRDFKMEARMAALEAEEAERALAEHEEAERALAEQEAAENAPISDEGGDAESGTEGSDAIPTDAGGNR